MKNNNLNPKGLGLACGIVWGVAVLIIGLAATKYPLSAGLVFEVYPWSGPGLVGSIIGAIWGFVDGFIGGAIVAWLYNRLS